MPFCYKFRVLLCCCLVIGCFLSPLPGWGFGVDTVRPIQEYRLDTWSVRDGLPSRVTNAIAQTPDGFIWLGTPAGLIRFDGVSFDTYDSRNTPSLPVDNITALLAARDGTLWVGTEWGGFGTFSNGKFVAYAPRDKHWAIVKTMVQDPDGSIWVGGWGDVPLRHVVDGKVTAYTNLGTKDPGPNVLLPDGHGAVICGFPWDNPRLLHSDGSSDRLWQPTYFGVGCRGLLADSSGAIWYASSSDGLFEIKDGKVRRWTTKQGLATDNLTSLCIDRGGSVWVGTTNGICRWDGKRMDCYGKMQGLPDSAVGAIVEDRESNLWVATGVVVNRFAAPKLFPITMSDGTDEAVVDQQGSLSAGDSDMVWCATNKGIWRITSQSVEKMPLGAKLDYEVVGLAAGRNGDLWTWTSPHSGQIYVWKLSTGKNCAGPLKVVNGPFVMPPNVGMWEGIARPGELIGFGSGKVFIFRPGKPITISPFPGVYEFCAQERADGSIWFGDSIGLIRWQKGNATVFDDGLPAGTHVLSVDVSDPSCVWLATDHGLAKFQNGHSRLVGKEAGLPDSNLFQILRDDLGNLWIGSHFGIFSVRERDVDAYLAGTIRSIPYIGFGASDGIRSFPTIFACTRTSDGRLAFAGDTGITMVTPGKFEFNPIAPPVVIQSADVDGTVVTSNKRVIVKPGSGRFSVRFAGLSFTAPEKVRFRYMLQGLDTSWSEEGSHRAASYPYLPPGSYRFVVVACNNDGVWNSHGASVSFVILPHYYQTLWFKALMLLLGIAAIGGFVRVRMRQIMRRNQELEAKVAERTVELSDAHEKLEVQYEELENRAHELEAMQAELESQNDELIRTQESLNEANGKLAELATTDGLTGLKNRRAFQERLELEWERARRYNTPLSLIILDVDKFKSYNDTYGHPAGDEVLRRVGRMLTDHARESDFVARYGGEEFVVIAADAEVDGGLAVAERFRSAIENGMWPDRPVTASFGVATLHPSVNDVAELLSMADAALYASKEGGRNRVTHSSNVAHVSEPVNAPAPSITP